MLRSRKENQGTCKKNSKRTKKARKTLEGKLLANLDLEGLEEEAKELGVGYEEIQQAAENDNQKRQLAKIIKQKIS